jgi:subtilisin family serine protease
MFFLKMIGEERMGMRIFGLSFSKQSLAVAALVFVSGMDTPKLQAQVTSDDVVTSSLLPDQNGRMPYIVGLKDAPLALYDTVESHKSAPLPKLANGRLDVKAPEAIRYVEQLRSEQSALLANFNRVLGRELAAPQYQMQHAFNGMVLMLTEEEALRITDHPSVSLVEAYREYPLNTDVGPRFIGADKIWDGSNVPGGLATRGEGVVIGVIDSGANLGSPSFANTDLDGYVFVNPLGTGNYLGWCNPAHPNHNPSRDLCNNKIIGGWDFVDSSTSASNQYEAPGFEDENGHGSHTASTAAGNRRNATVTSRGVTVTAPISGVAPRANLVIYDVCYTPSNGGSGLCPNTSSLLL